MIFVSDYYLSDIVRGAEACNNALLSYIPMNIILSKDLKIIDSTKRYFISNFVMLSEAVKQQLIKYKNYIIYEHDHKYTLTRNPFLNPDNTVNPDGIVPEQFKVNQEFYKNALVVLCQTKWHQDQLAKNLDCSLDNIGGSLYTQQDIDILNNIISQSINKIDRHIIFNDAEFIVLHSGEQMFQGNNIKNKKGALKYCIDNKISYMFIPRINNQKKFWETIYKYKGFVFLPDIPETCSRLLIETKMLGLEVITNTNTGAYWEPWFKLNGKELIDEFSYNIIPNAITKIERYINVLYQ